MDLASFARLIPLDHGLCVLSTQRADRTIQSSLVSGGVSPDPITGDDVASLVAAGGTRKLANLRANPACTIVARAGFEWTAVEGTARIIGPDDPHPDVDAEALRLLLRSIFEHAGGTHDDWDEFDRVMARERRAAVLITPSRVYGNAR